MRVLIAAGRGFLEDAHEVHRVAAIPSGFREFSSVAIVDDADLGADFLGQGLECFCCSRGTNGRAHRHWWIRARQSLDQAAPDLTVRAGYEHARYIILRAR